MVIRGMDKQLFEAQLQEKTAAIEELLREYLPEETGCQKTVLVAMNYSLTAGGKRLRPMLMAETFKMFGEELEILKPFMAAVEMMHTYSLVHDDLPAMDNDEYRRGRKTTWSVYGEAMGILAGDALLNYAMETALTAFGMIPEERVSAGRFSAIVQALQVLFSKAGIHGMIGGQTADIEAERRETLDNEEILFIHEHKTAALIQASMMVGAILAGASEMEVESIEKCAYNIGIAFQIQDDILDVMGNVQELGKPIGSDAESGKQTYVTINGIEQAKQEVERLSREAVAILNHFEGEHAFLEELILQLIYRRK